MTWVLILLIVIALLFVGSVLFGFLAPPAYLARNYIRQQLKRRGRINPSRVPKAVLAEIADWVARLSAIEARNGSRGDRNAALKREADLSVQLIEGVILGDNEMLLEGHPVFVAFSQEGLIKAADLPARNRLTRS